MRYPEPASHYQPVSLANGVVYVIARGLVFAACDKGADGGGVVVANGLP